MGKKLDLENDFFSILGVKASSSDEDVKKAYKALAKQWHPDKNGEAGAEETFKLIASAYDTLKTADGRSIYRREKENALAEKDRESRREKRDATSFRSTRSDSGSRFTYNKNYSYDTGPSSRGRKYYTSSQSDSGPRFYSSRTDEDPYTGPYSNGFQGRSPENEKNEHKYKKSKAHKAWSNDWDEPDEDGYTPFGFSSFSKPSFSYAFNSFVDDLFDFSSFINTPSGSSFFEAFFSGPENMFDPFAEKGRHDPRSKYFTKFDDIGNNKKARNDKHDHANSYNMGGRKADDIPGFSFDDYSDDEDKKFECSCCGKAFVLLENMVRHESVCKEVNEANPPKRPVNGTPVFGKPTGDWRATHEELIKNLRNMRRSSQTAVDEDDEETSPSQNSDYVKCHMCGRTFYKSALDRHVSLCRMRNQAQPPPFPAGKPPPGDPNGMFGTKDYPRTMPAGYPGSSTGGGIPRSSSRTSQPDREDLYSSTGRYPNKTCLPNLGRKFMDEPFVHTSTGLHSQRSPLRTSPRSPRAMPDLRFPPPGMRGFGVGGNKSLGGNLCPNCQSVYAKNARYCMKCGFKR